MCRLCLIARSLYQNGACATTVANPVDQSRGTKIEPPVQRIVSCW